MITLKLTVPNDLAGASLLGVHNWIKSHIARTNPGGSPDYSVSDMSGNQLTLSDVARNPGSEIMVNYIEGVKINPSSLAPVPGIEFTYPSLPRTGNDITTILPDEIDSALAQRIISEQGLNRGLHTLNRLLLRKSSPFPVSPTTAAVLQMGQNLLVKNNPADRTPFTQRTPNFYSPEKALESYLKHITGVSEITAEARNAIFDAGVAAKYGLNRENIEQFAADVAAEFLWAASSNRGFIRMVIARLPDLRGDRTTIAKLLEMFPQRADQFYNGTQNVFVASPIFIYPNLGNGLLTDGQLRTIISAAENYPQNVSRNRFPRSLSNLIVRRNNMLAWGSELIGFNFFFGSSVDSRDQADRLDRDIERRGFGAVNQRLIESVSSPRELRRLQRVSSIRPIGFFSDIGGFYPSPPPKWPAKLVYATMDAMLENLPRIVNIQNPMLSRLYPIALQTTVNLPNEVSVQQPYADIMPVGTPPSITLSLKDADGNYQDYTNSSIPALRALGFFIPTESQLRARNMATVRRDTDRRQVINARILEAIENHITQKEGTRGQLRFDPTVQGISMLELVYLAAEIATDKYDYNPRGDDYLFIAALLHYTVEHLVRQPRLQRLPAIQQVGFLRRFGSRIASAGTASATLLALFINNARQTLPRLRGVLEARRNNDIAALREEIAALRVGMTQEEREEFNRLRVMIEGLQEAKMLDDAAAAVENLPILGAKGFVDGISPEDLEELMRALLEINNEFVNPPSPDTSVSYKEIQDLTTLAKAEQGKVNKAVVKALAGNMSDTALSFVSQPTYTSDAEQNRLIKEFYQKLQTMVEINRLIIKDVAKTIERDLPSVFKVTNDKVTINSEPMMEIRGSIARANELIGEAELEFAEVMAEMQRVGSNLKASMGAHPKFQQALERAAYIDLNDTLLFNKLDTSEESIYNSLSQIEFDAVSVEGFKQIYHSLFEAAEELIEVYTSSDLFLNQGDGQDNKDPQSLKYLQHAFNTIRNNYLNDVKHLRLSNSLNSATADIDSLKPTKRIEDLTQSVEQALNALN